MIQSPEKSEINHIKLLVILNSYLKAFPVCTLREESSQTNVILQYELLAAILSAVCSVIQQS